MTGWSGAGCDRYAGGRVRAIAYFDVSFGRVHVVTPT